MSKCTACGDKPENTAKDFTKAVIEINNPETLVLLRKVVIPASMGDDTDVVPAVGKYHNVILQYEANGHIYLYSSDGIPTAIEANIPQEVLDQIAELENDVDSLERADQGLQQEIDELKNSPDVVDIVATYADLQAYDTSTLGDKDVIRVLEDETHSNESAYYRWDKTNSQWVFIGAVEGYYTKDQTDDLLDAKQDLLTPGENITIEDESGALVISATDTKYTAGSNVQISPQNVISATDTTYTHFTGTDGTTAGTAGLVPAPATTDAGKFLKADGTWDDAAGSTYTAGDGIDITNDVISATNTGKARELTADDYDWPTDNPDGVALWLLDNGLYHNSQSVKIYYATESAITSIAYDILVTKGSTSMKLYMYDINSSSNDIAVRWVRSNGSLIRSHNILSETYIVNNLTSTDSGKVLSANQGKVLKDLVDSLAIRGAGAPTTATVGQVGTLYEDTTNGDLYICTDATNPYVWEEVGAGGGGPTVVQVPGTSTTSVMSQNATTGMVYADPADKYKVQIGSGANCLGYGVAIGSGATVGSSIFRALSLGSSANATANDSIALGSASYASQKGEMNIGNNQGNGYNNSNYRLLTGLYDPQNDHDAATKGYVDGLVGNIDTALQVILNGGES